MNKRPLAVAVILLVPFLLLAGASTAQEDLFDKSYALVIGIGNYPERSGFDRLTYPRKDAGGVAVFLRDQGFEVMELYDEDASRRAILATLEDVIAARLEQNDRVLIFYSGHGQTRLIGGKEYGYIIPYDADDRSSSWIGMDALRNISDKMSRARHQLFIMDACYGGQIGVKAIGPGVALTHPDYVRAISERPARQFLTAGGADQQVLDGGPDGYSYFTGFLLEALELGHADLNGDSYITASELGAYITPRASTWNQTPSAGVFPGHGQGEFLFRVPGRRIASEPGAVDLLGQFKGGETDEPAADPEPDLADANVPDIQVARVDPGALSRDEAAQQLTEAIRADYDRTRRDFYRFVRAHSSQDIDTRRISDLIVARVEEVREDGWVVKLDYFAVDTSRRLSRRQGYFLVRPADGGVEFIEVL